MVNRNIVEQVFSLSDRVRNEARELDKLPGAALAALVGGSVVIGVLGGGLFWIPAAMAGAMFGYRAFVAALQYPSYRMRQKIIEVGEVRKELEDIELSPLAIEHKRQLADVLLAGISPKAGFPIEQAALEYTSSARAVIAPHNNRFQPTDLPPLHSDKPAAEPER